MRLLCRLGWHQYVGLACWKKNGSIMITRRCKHCRRSDTVFAGI